MTAPTESVMRAANLLARVLAEGGSYAEAAAEYPRHFGHLTASERTETRRYARQADLLRQWMDDNPDADVRNAPSYIGLGEGTSPQYDLLVTYGPYDPERERYQDYKVGQQPITPASSASDLIDQALEELADESDPQGAPNRGNIVGTVLPFNLYG